MWGFGILVALIFLLAIWALISALKEEKAEKTEISKGWSIALKQETLKNNDGEGIYVITEVKMPPVLKICRVTVFDRLRYNCTFGPTVKIGEKIEVGIRTLQFKTEVYPGARITSRAYIAGNRANDTKEAMLVIK